MTTEEIITQLKREADGLLFMSESDYPLEVFHWDKINLSQSAILEKTGHTQDVPVKLQSIDDFFQAATTEKHWHDEEEKETVKKFQNLITMLKNHLRNLQVYRIGKREINVYVIGTTAQGDVIGISTKVVET